MKRIISWIIVFCITVAISVILFVTGKQHKIMLINGNKGETVPARVSYIVDGQDTEKPKSVRANKKGVVFVKGSNHVITIKYKDENGENKEVTKKFKASLSKQAVINFAGMIEDRNDWITYTEKEKEEPSED